MGILSGAINNAAENTVSFETVKEAVRSDKTDNSVKVKKKNYTGKTIGNPELSDKAAKYYEQLKSKFSNCDFILVSEDKKEQAKAQASQYANAGKMVVLVNEDKIERMANDENFRKQTESLIANASTQMPGFKESIEKTGANIKGFGMQVNDNGTAEFFAVLEKSNNSQSERIVKKAAEKKAAKKAAEKKAQKKQQQERLEKKRTQNAEKSDEISESEDTLNDSTITITASSIEELIKKINDSVMADKSDSVQTREELKIGQHIDIRS